MIELTGKSYILKCQDGAAGMMDLPRGCAKLVYGSPPYPNAERDYGVWRTAEYIENGIVDVEDLHAVVGAIDEESAGDLFAEPFDCRRQAAAFQKLMSVWHIHLSL